MPNRPQKGPTPKKSPPSQPRIFSRTDRRSLYVRLRHPSGSILIRSLGTIHPEAAKEKAALWERHIAQRAASGELIPLTRHHAAKPIS